MSGAMGRASGGAGTSSSCTALRIVESGLITSFPGAATQPLHADTDGDPSERAAVAVKVQVGTVNVTNSMGPLEVMPRSHLWSNAPPDVAAWPTLQLPVPPGGVLIYDTRVWHRGGANRGKRKRPVFYLTLLGPGAVPAGLPFTIYPEEASCFLLTAQGAQDWHCHPSTEAPLAAGPVAVARGRR